MKYVETPAPIKLKLAVPFFVRYAHLQEEDQQSKSNRDTKNYQYVMLFEK
jgi:hypothetical protein